MLHQVTGLFLRYFYFLTKVIKIFIKGKVFKTF